MELGTRHQDVLQQLEDLRLAEWSDHAPPPPAAPNAKDHVEFAQHRNYVNYPVQQQTQQMHRNRNNNGFHREEPIYVPGQYQVRLKLSIIQLCIMNIKHLSK